jgi:hypothetical protein
MAFHRPLIAASILALIPLASACGGSDTIVPEGTHYHYVANKALVPTNNNESREYGLDLNGDGTVDNQLGMVLGTLAGMGFDIQATIDKAVLEGSIILLADFQTKDFMSTAAAGVQVFLGTNPQPVACNAGEMAVCDTSKPAVCTGCGHHINPSGGTFAIDTNSPNDVALAGKIVGGTFTGGPGNLSLQIALGGTTAIQLDLIGAKAKASGITADNIGTISGTTVSGGIVFAGAITKDDIDNKVIPAVQTQLGPTIMKDCTMPTMPPGCGCTDGSTGKTILGLFDTNHDCTVSVDEIKSNSLIMSLLAPDVTVDGKMALSLGIKALAEKATFTVTGETM